VTLRALVVDWGGVLTPSVGEALAAWGRSEGLEPELLRDAFGRLLGPSDAGSDTIHLLERGEIDPAEVEGVLALHLEAVTGTPVRRDGMLARMFSHFTHAPDMTALVRRAHDAGIATALLSNSWGDHYPEQLWDGTFDVVVLSGQVGMRKPDPAIFHHTTQLLGLDARTCVFVDDLPHNVAAAARVGMVGVLHESYEATAEQLSSLFGRDLRGSPHVG
jgi:epoxide hydrolase-like predicted phosphatase